MIILSDIAKNTTHIILALVVCVIIVREIFFEKKHRLKSGILHVALSTLCWNISTIIYHATTSENAAYSFYDLDLSFICYTAIAMFIVVLRFYNLEKYMTKSTILVVGIIPFLTFILALTNTQHNFLRETMQVIQLSPHHQMYAESGVWFWVHSVYSYAFALLSLFVSITQHSRLPKAYSKSASLLMLGIVIAVSGSLITLLGLSPINLDFSLIGTSLFIIIIHIATKKNQGLDFLLNARDQVFSSIEEGLLMLDDERMIVQKNPAASQLLNCIKGVNNKNSYDEILLALEPSAIKNSRIVEETGGIDIAMVCTGQDLIFNIFEKPIFDNDHRVIGMLVIITNVTENRELIRKLEESTGQDALTGLGNLRWMENAKAQLNRPEYLPITAIMGDLNNLKKVNDTLGHQQGDVLLRVTAETLTNICPPTARLARIGGDEFLILLPNTTMHQAQAIVADIKHSMSYIKGHQFVPSLAMGYAVKQNIEQHLEDVINIADGLMYEDKQAEKAAVRAKEESELEIGALI